MMSRLFLLVILCISIFPFLFVDVDAGTIVSGGDCKNWCPSLSSVRNCPNNCDIGFNNGQNCKCTDELTPEETAKKIGTIVGIVIGCLIGVCILTAGVCVAYNHRKLCFTHIPFGKITTTHTIYNTTNPSQNATITTEREIRPGMYNPYGFYGGVTTVATIHQNGPTDVPPADAPPAYHDGYTQPPGYAPTLITSHPTSSQLPPQTHMPQTHIPQIQPQGYNQPTTYNQPQGYAQPSYAQPTYTQPQGYAQPSYVPQYGQPQGYPTYMSNPVPAPYQQSAPVEFEPVIKPGRKASGYVPVNYDQ